MTGFLNLKLNMNKRKERKMRVISIDIYALKNKNDDRKEVWLHSVCYPEWTDPLVCRKFTEDHISVIKRWLSERIEKGYPYFQLIVLDEERNEKQETEQMKVVHDWEQEPFEIEQITTLVLEFIKSYNKLIEEQYLKK